MEVVVALEGVGIRARVVCWRKLRHVSRACWYVLELLGHVASVWYLKTRGDLLTGSKGKHYPEQRNSEQTELNTTRLKD